MVADGRFAEDLYYRLNVIPIAIPPLRDRRDDIPALVDHFLQKHARRAGKQIDGIEEAAQLALRAYDWPGNVRELENTIERAVVLSSGGTISTRSLPALTAAASSAWNGLPSSDLHRNQEWVERETIRRAPRGFRWGQEGRRRPDRYQSACLESLPHQTPHRLRRRSRLHGWL